MDIAKILIVSLIYLSLSSCSNDKPHLSRKHMEWKMFNRNLKIDDPNYPVELIEDGYKMIKAYRVKARAIKGIEFPDTDEVEWGWKATMRNKINRRLKVTIRYILKDKDEFEITFDTHTEYIEPNETITIRSTSTMDYNNLERVASSGGTFEFSYAE